VEAFGNKARFDGMAVLAGCFGRDAAGKRPGRCRWRSHPWLEMDLNRRDPLGCRNEDTNAVGAARPLKKNIGEPSAMPIAFLSPLFIRECRGFPPGIVSK
jgi:hypothetical protein